jgi:hypothetical protein
MGKERPGLQEAMAAHKAAVEKLTAVARDLALECDYPDIASAMVILTPERRTVLEGLRDSCATTSYERIVLAGILGSWA